jgi:hypothetical protein
MNREDKEFFIKNRVLLVQRLEPQLLCDYFVEEGLFNTGFVEDILHPLKTQKEQNRLLLDILVRRGPNALAIFLKGLRKYQPDLTLQLLGGERTREVGTQTNDAYG